MRIRCFLFFLYFPFFIYGQEKCTLTLHGHVEDNEGNSLPGATVFIQDKNLGKITDNTGAFTFHNLCKSDYTLIINFIGYTSDTLLISLDKDYSLVIQLNPDDLVLSNINIVADKTIDPNASFSLSGEQLERTRGQTLGETVKQISGVTTLQTGPGIIKPVIHGLHSNRILILNNGIRQEGQQWGSEHAPEIDPFIASEITVVKGADAVKYGSDAIGGLIIVEPPKLHTTRHFGGEVNVSGMTNSRMGLFSSSLEGPVAGKTGFAWRLQGTYKKAGDAYAPNYSLTNTGITENNLSAGLAYHKDKNGVDLFISRFDTEIGILRSAHISNLTDLEQAISSNVPSIVEDFSYTINNPRQEAVHHLLKVNSYHFLKKDEKLEIQYGGQLNDRKEFDIRRTNKDLPALDLTLQSHSLDVSLNRIKGNHKRTVGINNSYQTNRWDPLTGKVPLIPWFNQVNTGTFYISKWSFKQWETELGMRYDYKNVLVKIFNKANTLIRQPYNFHNAAATAGIQYDVNQKVVLSSHLGSAWRPPHVSELFSNGVHHGTATYEKGLLIGDNEDLLPNLGGIKPQPENSLKWITRAMADFNFIKVDASLYNHLINHFIYLAPMPGEFILTSRGAFPVYNYLQTNVYIRGVDGTANVILSKKLDYLFKVSIIQANDRQTGEPLVLIPPGQFENSLQLEFEGGEKVEDIHFSLGSLYVGRQSRVDPLKDFAPVPESYFLLNFHAGYTLLLKKHGLHFYLNIDNLLNTPYRSYMNRLRYFADDLGRNFTIRIKYDFHKHD